MSMAKQVLISVLCLLWGWATVFAQDTQSAAKAGQNVTIIVERQQVRFTSRSAVEWIQLQVFNQSGELVFDSNPLSASEINWALLNADGVAIGSGLYAYTLSIKETGADNARVRRGHIIVDRASDRDGAADRLWVTSQGEGGVGAELTVARDESATIAGAVAPGRSLNRAGAEISPENKDDVKQERITDLQALNVSGIGTAGQIAKFLSAEELGNSAVTEMNGKVGIGTTIPEAMLHLFGGPALAIDQPTVGPFRSGQGYSLRVRRFRDLFTSSTDFMVDAFGNVGVGTAAPTQKLDVVGNINYGQLTKLDVAPSLYAVVNAHDFMLGHPSRRGSPGRALVDFGSELVVNFGGDWARTTVSSDLNVQGQTTTNVLQITGGADFAENFEVNAAPVSSESALSKAEPGMVVSIDPTHPGELALSAQAYDRRVAGIISGAGGVKPGMMMSQEGTLAHGKQPVSLSGRVYCWVDASQGAIEPGDLLTTSDTAGHAMKVADTAKAQGAIIGKAMTALKEGRGLVLVLVTLQ
jgi:hypothetical protein